MTTTQRLRNVGISAHIDSGKTTLTERMLFYCGRIHDMHEVHSKDGNATMDSNAIEQKHGITIMSAVTRVDWNDHWINIIDTPGHIDFTIEVERSLRVLDGAVMVLCSVGGVQSQSLTVDRQMRRYGVPRIAFINKMDRTGANHRQVINEIRDRLNANAVALQIPIGEGEDFVGVVDLIEMEAIYFEGKLGQVIRRDKIPAAILATAADARTEMLESLALLDDSIMTTLLDGNQSDVGKIRSTIRTATIARQLTPVLLGSAYKNKGVQNVLDAITMYLPSPAEREAYANDNSRSNQTPLTTEADNGDVAPTKVRLTCDSQDPLVAMAFKTVVERFGQLTFLRVYQGRLEKGQSYMNARTQNRVRFGRLVRVHSDEREEISCAEAGDIVAVVGVDCASGDTFTSDDFRVSLESSYVPQPVMSLAIAPARREDSEKLSKALDRYRREDPTFQVSTDPNSAETLIAGMGQLHLEVYVERIKEEFDCECVLGHPSVAYQERPSRSVQFDHTFQKQTGGPGQFARINGRVDPWTTESDAQSEFAESVTGGRIERKFISATRKGFEDSLKRGPLGGFEVVGIKMTLNDGSQHSNDSTEIAFRNCASQLMRDVVFEECSMKLWEPLMKLQVEIPGEFQGVVAGHIARRRGIVTSTENRNGICVVTAETPLAELFDYANDVRSLTQGNGTFTMEPCEYRQTPERVQQDVLARIAKPTD